MYLSASKRQPNIDNLKSASRAPNTKLVFEFIETKT